MQLKIIRNSKIFLELYLVGKNRIIRDLTNFGNTQFIGTLNPQTEIIMNNCRPTVALAMVVPLMHYFIHF